MMTIKEMRSLLGLTQAEFGTKYNIPTRTIEDWERGARTPPQYVLELC
ncbi:MAG: helix-turn-helix domain-containing protein [Lachnospiraceae bacterium]|nr:helix-turn-helix domain-containing protein [Lachnospiraceae bacterium]